MEALCGRVAQLAVCGRPAAAARPCSSRGVAQGSLGSRPAMAGAAVLSVTRRSGAVASRGRSQVVRAVVSEPPAAESSAGEMVATAELRSLKGSVNKVRRVLDVIRNRDYEEALMILEFLPQRCCEPIQNLVLSCAANAKNKGMKKSKLFVSEVFADQGPYMRRFQPRAQGRAYAIRKPTCHISIKMLSHETSKRSRPPIKLATH